MMMMMMVVVVMVVMMMIMVITLFQAGKFHGQGEYSWSNGAKYVGEHDQVSCDWRRSGHVTPCSPLIGRRTSGQGSAR